MDCPAWAEPVAVQKTAIEIKNSHNLIFQLSFADDSVYKYRDTLVETTRGVVCGFAGE
jgi:hypothetical protein